MNTARMFEAGSPVARLHMLLAHDLGVHWLLQYGAETLLSCCCIMKSMGAKVWANQQQTHHNFDAGLETAREQ